MSRLSNVFLLGDFAYSISGIMASDIDLSCDSYKFGYKFQLTKIGYFFGEFKNLAAMLASPSTIRAVKMI